MVEKEYQRHQDEYKRTSVLFEQDQERTGQLKDQLETTINMRVLEIKQRFKSYMGLFQFEEKLNGINLRIVGGGHISICILKRARRDTEELWKMSALRLAAAKSARVYPAARNP
ncbi:hypothetical protein P7H22_08060 [Paenibacillus larvae]|nr:hypothetical protein [Paenibacillus larvae]MDT2236230.1 hypothetical protein [Paenibacillus larvae]MDT2240290.1 hypothetical protein [Paenibacillus larvae]